MPGPEVAQQTEHMPRSAAVTSIKAPMACTSEFGEGCGDEARFSVICMLPRFEHAVVIRPSASAKQSILGGVTCSTGKSIANDRRLFAVIA